MLNGLWAYQYGKDETEGFKKQWHLHNLGEDLRIQGFWDQGYSGQGVTVAIVDDGNIDYTC
ncbi:pheromone processing endoprotease [Entomophthora muscae]|uniref:Pheromone processing endoprotease n=1 Tax=Entomophthora muscae TaxID=34485 RepID=A0ACC2SG37_9FUNG|nr:pheromone processing endoprotease [Entomophthora muscae]